MRRCLLLLVVHTWALLSMGQEIIPEDTLRADSVTEMQAEVDSLVEAMLLGAVEDATALQAEVDSLVASMVVADLVKTKRTPLIRPQQIIVPTALITLGAVAVGNPRLCDMKRDVRDAFQRGRGDHRKANIETWVTLSAQLLTVALGPKCKHSFTDRMLVKATGYALLYSTMPVVRASVREARPDGRSRHSFPSFKTANAFLAAEQVRIERGWAWGMGMYTIAAGIGVMQMYNDRAYINDVLAGAGMGILAVHGAYWLLPLERKWLGLDKKQKNKDRGLLVLPTFEPVTRTAGLTLTACL